MNTNDIIENTKELFEKAKNKTKALFVKTDDVNSLLLSSNEFDVLDAIYTIFELIGHGRDMSVYLPTVIRCIVSENFEIKRLVAIYIGQYSSKNDDVSLLCVSTLQKGLKEANHVTRGLCLRTLLHLSTNSVFEIQHHTIKQSVYDMSSYVKRIGCLGIPQLISKFPYNERSECAKLLEQYLADTSLIAFGCALFVLYHYMVEEIDLLHKSFYRLCKNLLIMDEFFIPPAIELLIIYARKHFTDQRVLEKTLQTSENTENPPRAMDRDYELMIESVIPLLMHSNSSVVLGVVKFIFFCAPESYERLVVEPILRLLNTQLYLKSLLYFNIEALVAYKADIFKPHLSAFYVKISDDIYTKKKKIDILTRLIDATTSEDVMNEFKTYCTYPQSDVAIYTIRYLTICAERAPKSVNMIVDLLLNLLQSCNMTIVAESIVVLRSLLQSNSECFSSNEKFNIVNIAEKLLTAFTITSSPVTRECIIWLVTEYCKELLCVAPDMLRISTKTFMTETVLVKHQIINLSTRLTILSDSPVVQKLCSYVFNLAKYDSCVDIRDRARFLKNIIDKKDSAFMELKKNILITVKPVITYQEYKENKKFTYDIGTLSFYAESALKGYKPILPFSTECTDPVVRKEVEENKEYSSITADDTTPEFTHEEGDDAEEEDMGSDTGYEEVEEEDCEEENEEFTLD